MDSKSFIAKATNQSDRVIRFIISDETTDREGDVLVASGCDFSEFQKNPQFLGFHDYRDFPMGIPKSWGVDTRAKNVWMNVYFPTLEELATDPALASEKAKQVDTVYNMYKMGMLNAVSVGFKAKERQPIENTYGSRVTKWELLEVSAVPIPCNPNAVAEARSIKSFDPKIIDQMEKAMEQKAGARFSKETQAKYKELVCKLKECHKSMSQIHDEMEKFMVDDGVDGVETDVDEPKALDMEKVSEYLRKSGKE